MMDLSEKDRESEEKFRRTVMTSEKIPEGEVEIPLRLESLQGDEQKLLRLYSSEKIDQSQPSSSIVAGRRGLTR